MKKIFVYSGILLFLMLAGVNNLFAQVDTCPKYNKGAAMLALKKNTPKVVIVGGIVRAIKPGDTKFAKKYKIQFIDTGCVIENTDCIVEFNKVTFAFLDRKYGKKWRKQIRQDLLGL